MLTALRWKSVAGLLVVGGIMGAGVASLAQRAREARPGARRRPRPSASPF